MTQFCLFAFLAFGYVIFNHVLDSKTEVEKKEALLVDKSVETYFDSNNVMMENYILCFDIDGEKKNFPVEYSLYKKYEVGSKGILLHKRNRFVDFKVEK